MCQCFLVLSELILKEPYEQYRIAVYLKTGNHPMSNNLTFLKRHLAHVKHEDLHVPQSFVPPLKPKRYTTVCQFSSTVTATTEQNAIKCFCVLLVRPMLPVLSEEVVS